MEQVSLWSRNQLAKEHQGLDILHVTLGSRRV